jgi:hypothetical protein
MILYYVALCNIARDSFDFFIFVLAQFTRKFNNRRALQERTNIHSIWVVNH